MKPTSAKYGENDVRIAPILTWYKGHIVKLESKTVHTGNVVFNPTIKISTEINRDKKYLLFTLKKDDEGSLAEVPVLDSEGNQKSDAPIHMIGKEYRGEGIWLTPNPGGERWRNERYMTFVQACGIKFPFKKLDNGVSIWDIQEIEEPDILGFPILFRIGKRSYTDKDGNKRLTIEAKEYAPWPNGKKVEVERTQADEDGVPF